MKKELEKDIKSFNKKIKKIKKESKEKIKSLDIENDSKLANKIKKRAKDDIKKLKKKIKKANDKILSLDEKNVAYIYLYVSKSNNKVMFWSLSLVNSDEFVMNKKFIIEKKDVKFFDKLFKALLNNEKYNIFINDEDVYLKVKKIIKHYNFNNKYEIII